MSTFDPPIVMTRDGEEITVRNTADYVRLRFDGWILVGPGGPEPVVGPSVKTVNGIPGPAVLLTAANIPGLEELIAGSSAGLSEAQVVSLINTATAALVNSAPAALNTLDELAAALGDDANFAATVTSALAGKAALVHTHSADDIVESSTGKVLTAAERTKLAGIATGATANSSDTFLRARSNHTGSQLANTISDFGTAVSAAISSAGYAPSADPTFTGVTTLAALKLGSLTKAADYTLQNNDPSLILVATGSATVTITLPTNAPIGTTFIIKKTDGNGGAVTVNGNVDTFTVPSMNSQYDAMAIVSTGGGSSNFHLLWSTKPLRQAVGSTDLGTVLSNYGFRNSGSSYTLSTSGSVAFSGGFAALANLRLGAKAISAAYTITTTDPIYILANATTAAFAVTLPSIATSGITYLIKKTDSTTNQISMTSMFDGQAATTITLFQRGDYVMVESTSTADQWIVVGSNRPMPGQQQGATVDLGVVLSNLGLRGSGTAYPITTSGAVTLSGTTVLSGTTTISNLRMNGGRASNVNTATANYTVGIGAVELQMCDATTAGFTATLPATTNIGNVFTFKKIDATANTVTITAGTGIDGATSIVLASKDDWVTVISSGTTGVWRIIARSAPTLLPSYLVTPSILRKNFDPSTGLYNFNARTMRRARAGLGKAAAGGFMRVLCMGDSTLVGFDGATTSEQGSYPRRLGAFLSQLSGAPLGGGMVPWTVNTTSMVSTGTVDRQAYPGLMTMYPGSTVTYTSVLPFTSHDLTYSNQSATFGVQIDGGAAVNPAVTGAGTMTKATTHTGLANTVHTIKLTAGSNYAYIALSDLKQASGIQISNIAVSGTTADLITTGVTSWANTAAAPTLKTSLVDGYQTLGGYDPDLIVIAIGGNDLYNGDTNAHAIAGAKKMKDYFPNASCLMIQGWRLGVVPAATANDYLERKYQLADQYDFALHDFQHVSGTYEEASALGVVGADTVHPSFGSLSQWGRSSAQALAAA